MTTPEGWEKKVIDAFLEKLGPNVVYIDQDVHRRRFGKSGKGDYHLCLCGSFWNVEVKRPGKNPTPIQTRRMNEVRAAGGHAVAGTARKW